MRLMVGVAAGSAAAVGDPAEELGRRMVMEEFHELGPGAGELVSIAVPTEGNVIDGSHFAGQLTDAPGMEGISQAACDAVELIGLAPLEQLTGLDVLALAEGQDGGGQDRERVCGLSIREVARARDLAE